jgi:hypothetical protein
MYYVGNGEIIATSEAYESKTSQAPMFSAFSQRSEASAVVQRELGAALHRHEIEILAMTVDEAPDEWAVGQHRQPLRSCGVQRGFDEQCSQALPLVRRVDLGVKEGDDAGSAPVLGKAQHGPVDFDLEASAV